MGDLEQITPSNKLISVYLQEGKTISQDFISSSVNPNHTAALIASFANSLGGELLIGINSKGKVVGVVPDEEEENIRFIIKHFCTFPIPVSFSKQIHDFKFVLIVHIIKVSNQKVAALSVKATPHYFVRSISGEVFEANKIIEKSWGLTDKFMDRESELNNDEEQLTSIISTNWLTISQIYKLTEEKKSKVDIILSGLIAKNLINYEYENMHIVYFLK